MLRRMPGLRDVFSAPFNWCDRRCERCPIAGECPVYRREQQLRWVHSARGLDPDDPELVLADMHQSIETTLRMVQEIAEAEGVDLDEPLPPRPTLLAARRLERTAMTLVRCVAEASRAGDVEVREATAELRSLATTVATKSSRIACHLENEAELPDEEVWAFDAAPNLLLLDRLKAAMVDELARLAGGSGIDAAAGALAELDRNLDPLIRQVGDHARTVLAALEARGAAPSPFLRSAQSASRASG